MSVPGINPNACVIIDNNVLAMMAGYYCKTNAGTFQLPQFRQWFADQIQIIGQYAPDGCVHCSQQVANEFKPAPVFDSLHQLKKPNATDYMAFTQHVRGLLQLRDIDQSGIPLFRTLPAVNKKFVRPGGISDNDFSLLALALELASQTHDAVYILTNEQDLQSYVTWFRTRPEAKTMCANVKNVQCIHGLHYIEAIYRNCKITKEQMQTMLHYEMREYIKRSSQVAPEKGESILQQLENAFDNFTRSTEIKLADSLKATPS